MCTRCSINCIVPPHILRRLLDSPNPEIRKGALNTLLATNSLRTERRLLATVGFLPNRAGTKRRTIYDCKNRRITEQADLVRGEGAEATGDGSVNRAYDGLGATYDFFLDVFKRNSIDDRGMRLDGYVHFGYQYNNAFWNGRQMVFGDGDDVLFKDFTGSLDVIAHELGHGVTEFTAGLEYHNQSGALNESMSDVFGSLVKQWKRGESADQADWLIGSDIFSPNVEGDALRSMKDPGQAYNDPDLGRDPQPGHMDNYVQLPDTEDGDWGGVHINSGIPNRAFYLAAVTLGGRAWDAAGHIWYEALRASGPTTEFQEFAEKTCQAAELYGAREQQAVADAWQAVGVRVRVPLIAVPGPAYGIERTPVLSVRGSVQNGDVAKRIEKLEREVRALKESATGKRSRTHVEA